VNFAMVIAEVTRLLTERGIRHGLAGAVALHAYGLTRATRDLDFVVEEQGREAILSHLASLGYELLQSSEGFSNHLHPDRRWGRLDDIQALLTLPGVDEERVRGYFLRHGLADRFESLQRARGRN